MRPQGRSHKRPAPINVSSGPQSEREVRRNVGKSFSVCTSPSTLPPLPPSKRHHGIRWPLPELDCQLGPSVLHSNSFLVLINGQRRSHRLQGAWPLPLSFWTRSRYIDASAASLLLLLPIAAVGAVRPLGLLGKLAILTHIEFVWLSARKCLLLMLTQKQPHDNPRHEFEFTLKP
jgi:hypothetical protein